MKMQDQFVADIGDYAKYGLLRAVIGEGQLGVAWYLHPNTPGAGGNHVTYLDRPNVWRPIDCELFDNLQAIIAAWRRGGQPRAVVQIENGGLFPPGTIFANERLAYPLNTPQTRAEWRRGWFGRVMNNLADCDIVFADPDNSLCHPDNFDYGRGNGSWQRLPLNEANQLCDGRPTVIYHHPNREAGMQHRDQILHWMEQIPGCTHAFLVRRWNARAFFAINFDQPMLDRLNDFVERWRATEQMIRPRVRLSELIPRVANP